MVATTVLPFERAKRSSMSTRLFAMTLSSPEVGSSRNMIEGSVMS